MILIDSLKQYLMFGSLPGFLFVLVQLFCRKFISSSFLLEFFNLSAAVCSLFEDTAY